MQPMTTQCKTPWPQQRVLRSSSIPDMLTLCLGAHISPQAARLQGSFDAIPRVAEAAAAMLQADAQRTMGMS